MLIRCIVLFLIFCTACRSGIIPCPEVKGLRLKKSHVNKRLRFPERSMGNTLQQAESVITVSTDAKTLQPTSKNKYRYVKYTMQHIDVEEMDCPKPGAKKTMPRTVKENIRKNKKKIRHYYREINTDSLELIPATYPQR